MNAGWKVSLTLGFRRDLFRIDQELYRLLDRAIERNDEPSIREFVWQIERLTELNKLIRALIENRVHPGVIVRDITSEYFSLGNPPWMAMVFIPAKGNSPPSAIVFALVESEPQLTLDEIILLHTDATR